MNERDSAAAILRVPIAVIVTMLTVRSVASDDRATVAERVLRLTRQSAWKLVTSVPIPFRTYHPQGMVKIGDALFVSSVEIKVPTKRFPQPVDGYDRDAGDGVGHLFKLDLAGNLIADLKLGEGAMYHPGGIDYDGEHIWVAVAEYRPNSHAIIYRVDPRTMKTTEVFRVADHIGAIVHDTADRALHGVSWGSRHFYRWPIRRNGTVTNTGAPPTPLRTLNRSHYVDYQDCHYVGNRQMLCSGVTELRQKPGSAAFRLGGLELVDLRDGRVRHQVPVLLWTEGGLAMTQNPVWIEPSGSGLRAYFLPDDDSSKLYVFEVVTK